MNKNRKGFTVVELVIVIAIIAILAAVLIPTFASLIAKANVSVDTQLVRNLNNALTAEKAGGENNKTMYDALMMVKSAGYDIDTIVSKSGNNIAWDSKNDRFVLIDPNNNTYIYPTESGADSYTIATPVDFFVIYNEVPALANQRYSVYLSKNATVAAPVEVKVGFDAGENTDVRALTYTGVGTAQNVVIRTNSFATTLTINDSSAQGKIYHYDNLGKLIITDCAMESYHEMGIVGYAELKNGHLVVEENASINLLFANTQDSATLKITNNGTITNAQASSDSVKNTISGVDFNRASAETVLEDDITTAVQVTHQSNCEHANVVVSKEAVEATCTQTGLTAEESCADCHKVLIAQEVVSATGSHNYGSGIICTVCGTLHPEKVSDIIANDKLNDKAFINNKSITKIVIPEGVTSIGTYAFSGCTNLESVTIPASVETIGQYAFKGCSSLTSVTIPASVRTIGTQAFRECTSLTSVTLENGLTTIGEQMFFSCFSLENVNIPASVETIGQYAFKGCSSLESVTISEGVTSIGSSAFNGCSSLTSITIPNSVTSIGSSAFYGCTKLTSITIPENVESIGNSAFYNCKALESITIPESVTSIESSTFYGCSSLSSVTIPEEVTSIKSGAFQNCTNLTNIKIPDSVTGTIEIKTFSGCSNLKSITIGAGITHISMGTSGAFNGTNLETIEVSSENKTYKSVDNCIIKKDDNKLVLGCKNSKIPNGVTTIGQYAFYMCSGLTGIEIPNSVKTIETYAFASSGLTSIVIPDSVVDRVENGETLFGLGSYAFNACTALSSVTLSKEITSIQTGTFRNCTSLKTITIPAKVKTIGESAFNGAGLTTAEFKTTSGWNCKYYDSATRGYVTIDITITSVASEENADLLKGSTYNRPSFFVSNQ